MRRKLSGVPQAAQKSRSAIDEERNAAGFPRVQAKSSCSMSANEANGAPLAFWHIRQWQMLIFAGTPTAQSEPRRIGSRRSERGWSPSCSLHSSIDVLQRGQRIAAGKDEIVNAGGAERGFLFAGPACQIDMSGAGGLKGLCGAAACSA